MNDIKTKVGADNLIDNPDKWETGEEPATDAQLNYLDTLAKQAGTEFKVKDLTKAEAAKKIEALQAKTGRD